MVTKILCVAEKPSIAKAVANHLAGSIVPAVGTPGSWKDELWLTMYSQTQPAV